MTKFSLPCQRHWILLILMNSLCSASSLLWIVFFRFGVTVMFDECYHSSLEIAWKRSHIWLGQTNYLLSNVEFGKCLGCSITWFTASVLNYNIICQNLVLESPHSHTRHLHNRISCHSCTNGNGSLEVWWEFWGCKLEK